MKTKLTTLKYTISLFTFLLIVWGFYRLLFQLPEEIEEFLVKPAVWLGAVYFILRKEKSNLGSIGITLNNIFPAIYLSLALGAIFTLEGLAINYIKYSQVFFGANIGEKSLFLSLALSFATGISEEITFRGYIFNRVWKALGKEWTSNLITSIGWALVHLPIAIFDWKLSIDSLAIYLLLTTIFSIGSAFVFARTKNVFSSIFLHVMWEWPIILFR